MNLPPTRVETPSHEVQETRMNLLFMDEKTPKDSEDDKTRLELNDDGTMKINVASSDENPLDDDMLSLIHI